MDASVKSDFYYILELGPGAQQSEIKEAYRRLALQRHPDKNPGDRRAVAAFQKLAEAYETLYDESRRRQYDAKRCSPHRQYGYSPQETRSKQERDDSATETARVAKREREWAAQSQARLDDIARLKEEMRAAEAAIAEINRKERQRVAQEKQGQGWFSFLTSPWAAKPVERGEEEKLKQQQELQQQRTSKSIKLERTKNQLMQAEREHRNITAMQRQTRESEARKREERLREERMKAQREQAAQWRESYEKKAKEEAAKAEEAARKRAEDLARRKAEEVMRNRREELQRQAAKEAREKEAWQEAANRRERESWQEVLERLARKEAEARVDQHNHSWEPHSPAPKAPKRNAGRNSSSQHRRPAHQTDSARSAPTACQHNKFWPKVAGVHECSVCSKVFKSFILQCPDCKKIACASCKRELRKSGF
ncbi:MAG: hypothetical protein Q9217_002777 [Psora testacea]